MSRNGFNPSCAASSLTMIGGLMWMIFSPLSVTASGAEISVAGVSFGSGIAGAAGTSGSETTGGAGILVLGMGGSAFFFRLVFVVRAANRLFLRLDEREG